jgi:putative heme iron utilization protein
VTGVDPEGLDLALGDATLRLSFPHRITDASGLRSVLKDLAERARAVG